MRILFICHRWPYPPKRGGKIRPFNIISHLAESHEVTVASLVRSAEEEDEGRRLNEHCHKTLVGRVSAPLAWARMLARLPYLTPSSMGYFYSPDLARKIRNELATKEFDLIFVHCSSVAQYVAGVSDIPKVLDFGDMDSQKWLAYRTHQPFPMSAGYWLEGKKLMREEKRLAGLFDLCTCTTQQEFETLSGYGCETNVAWFPNGVNYRYFSPSPDPVDDGLISFVGRMDYYPNQQAMLEFCDAVFPRIRAHRQDARLIIVGADPSYEILQLGRIEGVTVTGSVPDVRPFVAKSAVNVAPLRIARGTQNKILEAMAMGVPVVTTSIAAAGVDAIRDTHLLCADSPTEFAEKTLALMNDPQRRTELGASGRQRVISNHDWGRSMSRLDGILAEHVGLH